MVLIGFGCPCKRLLDSTNELFTNRKWCSFSIIFTANISVVDIAEVRVASPGMCFKAWSRCSREAMVCGGGVFRTTSVTVGDLGDHYKTWICLSNFLKSLFYLVADTSPAWWRWRDFTTSSYFWHFHASIYIYYKFLYSQNQNYIYFKNKNQNYTWTSRKGDNVKPVSPKSTFFKSHLQYNARKLFNKLPVTLIFKFTKRKQECIYLKKLLHLASKNIKWTDFNLIGFIFFHHVGTIYCCF